MFIKTKINFLLDRLQWKIAWLIPNKIALYVFVRVYAITGRCDSDYDLVYDTWVEKKCS
jgi:hypothetical protein